MSITRKITVVNTRDPNGVALRAMGRAANEAANTWTMIEWARRLAAQAGEKDYRGQLEKLYEGIRERWRYTMEPGEWVAGSARSLLGNVLGLSYQGAADPTRAAVASIPVTPQTRGGGDCDDVTALVASGALALGMTPFFRVAIGDTGAHVSCVVRTPKGEMISVDPVGAPEYPFGWALPAKTVTLYTLDGAPAPITSPLGAIRKQMTCATCALPTLFAGIEHGRIRPRGHSRGHMLALRNDDYLGPRVLAIPERFKRLMLRGVMVDGTPARCNFGRDYRYDIDRDLWIDESVIAGAGHPLSGPFSKFRKKLKKRTAGLRKLVKRVAAPLRKIQAKILKSKLAQNAIGAALMSVGIPRAATKAVLEASGQILEKGGLPALIKMIKKDPRAAMQMVASAAKSGLKRATQVFSGLEDVRQYRVTQNGMSFAGMPVQAIVGVPYIGDLGELDVVSVPTPGSWYRVKKGDTLLAITSTAYGVKAGSERLAKSKWINGAKANAAKVDPKLKDNLYPSGRISMSPKFASDGVDAAKGKPGSSYALIWIPTTAGDEPSEAIPGETTPKKLPDVTPTIPSDPKTETTTQKGEGQWYQIQRGDTLLGITSKLYGVPSGSDRLAKSKWINNAKANAGFVDSKLKDSMYPGGRISMSPKFGAGGKSYAMIWAPGYAGEEPKKVGDLPKKDPVTPKDPTPKIDPPEDKVKKFKEACLRTPNGHYVDLPSGPGCMVCHPEKGESWDPISQTCYTKPITPVIPKVDPIPVDPWLAARQNCVAGGGTWDNSGNFCRPKPGIELPQVDPREVACLADGGAWDRVRNTCKVVSTGDDDNPDNNDDPTVEPDPVVPVEPKKEGGGFGIAAILLLAAMALGGGK